MLVADFYTKLLQEKKFRIFRNLIFNLDEPSTTDHVRAESMENINPTCSGQCKTKKCGTKTKLQECVEIHTNRTYKDVLCSVTKDSKQKNDTSVIKTCL